MKKSKFKWLTAACFTTLIFISSPHALANSNTTTPSSNFSNNNINYVNNTLVIHYNETLTYKELNSLNGVIVQQLPSLKTTILKFKNEDAFKNAVTILSTSNKINNIALSPLYRSTASDDKVNEQYVHTFLKTKNAYNSSSKKKVKIAVIDSGIDSGHPDLKGKILKAVNIVDPMKKQVKMAHGTHVSGIIAANLNNTIGGHGIYPNAEILSYDVFNGAQTANDFDIANAVLQAIKDGAKVINMSLGGYGNSSLVADAINKAYAKGITIIAAAGNDNSNIGFYPAALEHVISVGSTNKNGTRSSFSNYGSSLDVVAPGENIYSTSYNINRGSSFQFMSGTSMASPVTAGTAALLVSKHSKISPDQIEYILQHTSKDKGASGYDPKYGAGLIQPASAVAFDLSKIPALSASKWTDDKILEKAQTITAEHKNKGTFTKPNEMIWKKIAVKKGQYVQVTATPAKNYDLKLTMKMIGSKKQALVINDTAASHPEAGYIQATSDGFIAIGVNDFNGHIDSTFELEAKLLDSLKKDESSIKEPIYLKEPNSITTKLYMNENDNMLDEDAFHFTATDNKLMQINTSALYGVDLAIEVYKKEDLVGDGENGPLLSINKNGVGEAEFASFATEKGIEYYIVISNSANSATVPANNLLSMLQDGISQPKFSLLPYTLTINSKHIAVDEDKIVYDLDKSKKINIDAPDEVYSLDALYTKFGRAFTLDKDVNGYLQGSNDTDGYYFTSTNSAFYEFSAEVDHNAELPSVTLFEVDENGDEEFISTNSSYDGVMKKTTLASLKPKTKYLIEVSVGSIGSLPQKGYKITSKLLSENVIDAYENNDTPEKAKTLSVNKTYIANFAKNNDVDYYYFKAQEKGLYALRIASLLKSEAQFSLEWDNRYMKTITLYKDINHNKKLDDADLATYKALSTDLTGEMVTGSIEVNKGDSFFIYAAPENFSKNEFFSIYPYELSLTKAKTVDEDKNNKVVKNKPSKPIKLTKKNSTQYSKKGYMNPGHMNGDADWYSLKTTKARNATISVKVPESMDAVIQVYAKGKLVKNIDYYGEGDTEIGHLKLKKNTTYYFKITDQQGNSFVDPYELTIK